MCMQAITIETGEEQMVMAVCFKRLFSGLCMEVYILNHCMVALTRNDEIIPRKCDFHLPDTNYFYS